MIKHILRHISTISFLTLTLSANAQTTIQPSKQIGSIGLPPYGEPIRHDQMMLIVDKLHEKAKEQNSRDSATIVIVNPSGELIYAEKAPNAMYAEMEIAYEKARSSARYRTSSKWFYDQLKKGNLSQSMAMPGAASMGAGGVPIIKKGYVIGALAISGTQDDERIATEALKEIQYNIP